MPASTSCDDLLDCIDCPFIMSFFSSPNNSIIFNDLGVCGAFDVNPNYINNIVNSTRTSPMLTIGTTTHDLSNIFTNNVYRTIADGSASYQVNNQSVLNIAGLDGLRFFIDGIAPNEQLVIGLPIEAIVPDPNNQWAPIPGTRQHGQVLTWNAIEGVAYWDNNQCCAQTLRLDEATETLHISGTNSVWLGVLNNQTLNINNNILCISQPAGASQCVDLSETNNHTLEIYAGDPALHYFVGILNSNGVLQNQVSLEHMNNQQLSYDPITAPNTLNISQPGGGIQSVNLDRVNNHHMILNGNNLELYNSINELMSTIPLPQFDCQDVLDCTAIQNMITDIASLISRMDAVEARVTALEAALS